MKAKTCVTMTGCLLLMLGTVTFAADQVEQQLPTTEGKQIAQMGESHNKEQLRAWMNSIKPAAGPTQPAQQQTEYWRQSVHRGNRGHAQE